MTVQITFVFPEKIIDKLLIRVGSVESKALRKYILKLIEADIQKAQGEVIPGL